MSASGVYVLETSFVISKIPPGRKINFSEEIVPQISQNTQVMGYIADTEVIDIGTPERYFSHKNFDIRAYYGL